MSIPPFPSFFLIGAERAGVRWLRFNLDRHPDICAPPLDLQYFAMPDLMRDRGSRWYRQHFDSWRGEPFLGEACSSYLAWRNSPREVAGRMHRLDPEARLLAVVRQPLDRLYSAAARMVVTGDLPGDYDLWARVGAVADLDETALELVRGGVYHPSLLPYLELFGDQLHVLLYDDLVADPVAFYQAALRHIGADPTFQPTELARVRFASPPSTLVDFTDEQKCRLYDVLRASVEELETMLGRDLSAWDPALARA
jgi:hypothetical protein